MKLKILSKESGGHIDIGDGVTAYACEEIIEFYQGDEDLGICSYTRYATQVRKKMETWEPARKEQPEELEEETEPSDYELLRKMQAEENRKLEEMLDVMQKADQKDPLPQRMIQKQKVLAFALGYLLCDMEQEQERKEREKKEQPELPALKNSDQRKEWLSEYQAWGLWYLDERIGVRYFKYDFDNGARLIVEEHTDTLPDGKPFINAFYHLVGGPEPPKHPTYGYDRWTRHKTYCHHPDSMTELAEFLKEMQK